MSTAKSHIVFLTPGFAENETDTTSVPALQDYLKLIRQHVPGIQLTLLTFQFPFATESYDWHGITVIPLNGKNSKLNKISIWYNAWQTLQHLNRQNPITVIHSFWIGECSLLGQRFAAARNIRHIVTAMGQDVYKNKYARFLNPFKSSIVTLSENHSSLLLKNYRLKSEIIPWSIPVAAFPEMKENQVAILGVGSLNSVKNYAVFIAIIKSVAEKYPALKVTIIGEGTEFKNIQKNIAENKLTSVITLCGKCNRAAVYDKMSSAKILLHTSKYESFGYVFAEALYSGMKIVSFNVGTAKPSPQWKIATTETAMSEAVLDFLNENSPKSRVLLSTNEATIKAYLKLYHV